MAVKLKIKKNDLVKIIAGDDKGKSGKVLQVLPKTSQVVVEGCKIAKKAVKPSDKTKSGGWENRETPIHVSNVAKAED